MADQQKELQDLSDEFQKLQNELNVNIQARQKLDSQHQENQSVQKEFAKLSDDANIYKLIGPVLLKQDKTEAVMAVDGRLQYIKKEMIESQITETKEKAEKKRIEIYAMQTKMQQAQASS